MNLANKLTILRVILIPVFLAALLGNLIAAPMDRYVAVGIFIFASFTDYLDGYIARSQNMVTNFGKFLDPLADKLLVSSALIALVELGSLPAWFVILIISREFIISGIRMLAAASNIVISANMWGKLKTVFQMIMLVYVMVGYTGPLAKTIYVSLLFISAALTVLSAVIYIKDNFDVLKDQK